MWYGEEAVLQEYAALQAPTEEETASRWGFSNHQPLESCSRQALCMLRGAMQLASC